MSESDERIAPAPASRPVRLVAFYLPQFHPIPENDAWWGRGFTEWTNVARAEPAFPGHQQPRRPTDLGYYDLRVPEVREEQAALARRYGIDAFCIYHYWFNGRRLLERVLDEIVHTGRPDLPFCICWANENWTRRWDGLEDEVLLRQEHSEESDARFIEDVIPILRDRRYLHWDGKPLLAVYRANILPEPRRTAEIWRSRCRAHGIPEIHLVAAQTFGLGDPRPLGFDAALEFPPHGIDGRRDHRLEQLADGFHGKVYDYRSGVDYLLARPPTDYRLHRTAMTGWDNTPRRRRHAHVWAHATPDEYGRWLRGLVEQASADASNPDPLVFINAWNEWAEGAYLEPDETYGHSYLQATRRARLAVAAGPLRALAAPGDEGDLATALARLRAVEDELAAHRRANEWLRAELEARDVQDGARIAYFAPDPPGWLPRGEIPRLGALRLERVGPLDEAGALDAQAGRRMRLSGFAVADGVDPAAKEAAACLVLRAIGSDRIYFAPLGARVARPDVVEEFASQNGFAPLLAGFDATVWYEGVEPGPYEVGIVQRGDARVVVTFSGHRVRVPASP
jgi:hypothetical protein